MRLKMVNDIYGNRWAIINGEYIEYTKKDKPEKQEEPKRQGDK